jgi:hypothetical protein
MKVSAACSPPLRTDSVSSPPPPPWPPHADSTLRGVCYVLPIVPDMALRSLQVQVLVEGAAAACVTPSDTHLEGDAAAAPTSAGGPLVDRQYHRVAMMHVGDVPAGSTVVATATFSLPLRITSRDPTTREAALSAALLHRWCHVPWQQVGAVTDESGEAEGLVGSSEGLTVTAVAAGGPARVTLCKRGAAASSGFPVADAASLHVPPSEWRRSFPAADHQDIIVRVREGGSEVGGKGGGGEWWQRWFQVRVPETQVVEEGRDGVAGGCKVGHPVRPTALHVVCSDATRRCPRSPFAATVARF